jgi:cell wall-associated NlpC family hydrolase
VALEPVKYEMTAVFSQREGLAFNDALAETLDTTAEKLVPEAVARWYGGSEEAFRAAVCEQAKKYMDTEYRWGGKSGRGIDCSGLVSSAYMQCGVLIYRDAKIIEGWPMHEVAFENKKPGDALFFPGHVALYLGEGRYIHSTGAAVSGGVVINSLESSDPLYREDLVKCLYAVGSIF